MQKKYVLRQSLKLWNLQPANMSFWYFGIRGLQSLLLLFYLSLWQIEKNKVEITMLKALVQIFTIKSWGCIARLLRADLGAGQKSCLININFHQKTPTLKVLLKDKLVLELVSRGRKVFGKLLEGQLPDTLFICNLLLFTSWTDDGWSSRNSSLCTECLLSVCKDGFIFFAHTCSHNHFIPPKWIPYHSNTIQ